LLVVFIALALGATHLLGAAAATAASAALFDRGFWVPAIRPPTVPAGASRLRFTFSAAHGDDDVDRLLDALSSLAQQGLLAGAQGP